MEKNGRKEEAAKAYEITMKSDNQKLAVEAAFYHADLLKQQKKYEDAIGEFNHITVYYPKQDQWVVTAFAKIAECYEEMKQFSKRRKLISVF